MISNIKYWSMFITNTPDIEGGPRHGSKYSLASACKHCGVGALRNGPLYINNRKYGKKEMFITSHYDNLVSNSLANELALTGIDCFDDVFVRRGNMKLPFKVLNAEAVLPMFSTATSGYEVERQCEYCKRDGHFSIPHIPIVLKYMNLQGELTSKNVLCTYEGFGNSSLRKPFQASVIATPLPIVSTKFKEVVERHIPKISGVNFYPVYVD